MIWFTQHRKDGTVRSRMVHESSLSVQACTSIELKSTTVRCLHIHLLISSKFRAQLVRRYASWASVQQLDVWCRPSMLSVHVISLSRCDLVLWTASPATVMAY